MKWTTFINIFILFVPQSKLAIDQKVAAKIGWLAQSLCNQGRSDPLEHLSELNLLPLATASFIWLECLANLSFSVEHELLLVEMRNDRNSKRQFEIIKFKALILDSLSKLLNQFWLVAILQYALTYLA